MLANRIDDNPAAVARISHAVRHRTSESSWFNIDSTNLDDLVATRLPTLPAQRRNLLQWFAAQVDDDRFGSVRPPPFDELAAVVGVVNGSRVDDLFKSLITDGYIIGTDDGGFRLTSKGWEDLDPPATESTLTTISVAQEIIEAECPKCGPRRRADVVATRTERDPPDSIIYESTTLSLLRCRGCSTLFAKRETVFSEDEDHEQDPVTGEWVTVLRPTINYWPARERRSRPEWFGEVTDEDLRSVLDETYAALNGGLPTLSAMGVRAVLDKIFELAGADPAGGFEEKLRWLKGNGVIGDQEHDLLQVMTDAGSAASHRGWRPQPEQLATILDAAETTLHRIIVMPARAESLRASVPPRPRRRPRSD